MDEDNFSVVVITGGVGLEHSIHLSEAARRAGALTIMDVGAGDPWTLRTIEASTGHSGVRVTGECTGCTIDDLRRAGRGGTVILTADAPWPVADAAADHRVLVEVTSAAEARAAIRDGAHGPG